MTRNKITFYDLTPQPEDEIAKRLDAVIEKLELLLMPTEGRA